jgi:uncharacterized membrane protein
MSKRVDVPALIFASFSVLYPLIAVILLRSMGATAALALVMVLLAGRLLVPVFRRVPLSLSVALIPVLVAMAVVGFFDRELSIRLYPVFVNAALLVVFAASVVRPPTIAERFARGMEPDLPDEGVRYTRTVTIVWVAFFAVNGSIALWTVMQRDWSVWVLYNGLIAYVAAGVLFAGEYLVRLRVKRRAAR